MYTIDEGITVNTGKENPPYKPPGNTNLQTQLNVYCPQEIHMNRKPSLISMLDGWENIFYSNGWSLMIFTNQNQVLDT